MATATEREIQKLWDEVILLRKRIEGMLSRQGGYVENHIRLAEGADIKPNNDNFGLWERLIDHSWEPDDHFHSGSIPSGYAWAGTPFTTPTIDYSQAGSYLGITPVSTGRHFMYDSVSTYLNKLFLARVMIQHSAAMGIRMDDGSDDNYSEALLWYAGNGEASIRVRYRTGAGSVTATDILTFAGGTTVTLRAYAYNPTGSDIIPYYYWIIENGVSSLIGSSPQVSWAVARVGIVVQEGLSGTGASYCDWIYSTFE